MSLQHPREWPNKLNCSSPATSQALAGLIMTILVSENSWKSVFELVNTNVFLASVTLTNILKFVVWFFFLVLCMSPVMCCIPGGLTLV